LRRKSPRRSLPRGRLQRCLVRFRPSDDWNPQLESILWNRFFRKLRSKVWIASLKISFLVASLCCSIKRFFAQNCWIINSAVSSLFLYYNFLMTGKFS
jgi:hypothetical protein